MTDIAGPPPSAARRRQTRGAVLRALLGASNADTSRIVLLDKLAAALDVSAEEARQAATFMAEEGLLRFVTLGGGISITHDGVKAVEAADVGEEARMPPLRTVRSSYSVLDFAAWRDAGTLDLVPKFQRRAVWSPAARSFLIDSLIRGFPIPPIYLRLIHSVERRRVVREVVDGQQRISAILDYLEGHYVLGRSAQPEYQGHTFGDLPPEVQDRISHYPLLCEVLQGTSDSEILEIFARLNTYSIPLNQQELRNGTFFGLFKQSAYRLAYEHVEYWRRNNVFTERAIARMAEVELISELMVLSMDGLQDKKSSLNRFGCGSSGVTPAERRRA